MSYTTKHATFTLPEIIIKKIEVYKNKSKFIKEAIEEKIERDKKNQIIEWLKNRNTEYKEVNADFRNIQFNSIKD